MTQDEYFEALMQIEQLSAGDPAPDTVEGISLLALVGEAELYEVDHFPTMFRPGTLREIISRLRKDKAEAIARVEDMLTATDHLEKALAGYRDMLARTQKVAEAWRDRAQAAEQRLTNGGDA